MDNTEFLKARIEALEAELKNDKIKETSIKFAEWCAMYGIANHNDKWVSGALWSWGHQKTYTLGELFDKFIEEKK